MDTSKVSRVEVIDHRTLGEGDNPLTVQRGRVYVARATNAIDDLQVELSLQDDGRTLKVFVS